MTIFFDRACTNPDEIMDSISALHNNGHRQSKRVQFSIADPDVHEVQPYPEIYGSRPHFLLAGKNNWHRTPLRTDCFTGKSALVMRERRKQIKAKMKGKATKIHRAEIMRMANAELLGMDLSNDDDSSMDVDMVGKVCATRTKPANSNKYTKRVGAKQAKKLEIADNANNSTARSSANATTYRALSARCNYLSQDRPDIFYSSKELCRESSAHCDLFEEIEEAGQVPQRHAKVGIPLQMKTYADRAQCICRHRLRRVQRNQKINFRRSRNAWQLLYQALV